MAGDMTKPIVSRGPVNLAAIEQQQKAARKDLFATDSKSADPDLRIDAKEAATASPEAQKTWAAASRMQTGGAWGAAVEQDGAGGWQKSKIDAADVTGLQNMALRVLAQVVPYGAKEIPRELLGDLPKLVDTYWAETFQKAPKPQERAAMVDYLKTLIGE